MNFNWGRMERTPEADVRRKQDRMPFEELIARFERQAQRDIEVGNAWAELSRDIIERLPELDGSENARDVALEIGRKHSEFLRKEKGIESDDEVAAYITALAKEFLKRRSSSH